MGKRVAIIGAGYSGLCALKHFLSDPDFQVTGFEQADTVGGIWKYPTGCDQHTEQDQTSPFYCRIYRDLKYASWFHKSPSFDSTIWLTRERVNAPRDLMALEGLPFPQGEDSFCHWKPVADYLQTYARHFNLLPYIKFRHRVVQIIPNIVDNESPTAATPVPWRITYENLETKEVFEEIFDAVAVCNGHYNKPYVPDIPGLSNFSGQVIHSCDYRVPEVFRDKTVLLIGGSFSGSDIAIELLSLAKKIIISKPPYTKAVFPFKLDQVQETSWIQSFTADSCVLSDGSTEKIDNVILCTGYSFDCPFIHESCRLSIGRGHIKPLYHHLINCYYPTMASVYIGQRIIVTPVLDYQVKYFKAVVKGDVALPSLEEMLAEADKETSWRFKDGLSQHKAHVMDDRLWPYIDQLARELGIPSYEPVCRKMYDKTKELLGGSLLIAKQHTLRKLDADNFFVRLPG